MANTTKLPNPSTNFTADCATADMIMATLGGTKFIVMTGANDLHVIEAGVTFSLPEWTKDNIRRVDVILREDGYSLTTRRSAIEQVAQVVNIPAAELPQAFTSLTGMVL